jgi:hypothetical protein
MPPPCERNRFSRAWKFTPGTGMCPPIRYTASIMKVNSTRLRRSGMEKMFLKASIMDAVRPSLRAR